MNPSPTQENHCPNLLLTQEPVPNSKKKTNKGCLPFTTTFRKFLLESKWYMTFRVVPVENFWEQRNDCKSSPVFPDGMFQTEIHVPFVQTLSLTPVSGSHGHFLSQQQLIRELNGNENVTFKITSQSLKLLGDYSNLFNLSNAVELSRS